MTGLDSGSLIPFESQGFPLLRTALHSHYILTTYSEGMVCHKTLCVAYLLKEQRRLVVLGGDGGVSLTEITEKT